MLLRVLSVLLRMLSMLLSMLGRVLSVLLGRMLGKVLPLLLRVLGWMLSVLLRMLGRMLPMLLRVLPMLLRVLGKVLAVLLGVWRSVHRMGVLRVLLLRVDLLGVGQGDLPPTVCQAVLAAVWVSAHCAARGVLVGTGRVGLLLR